MNEFEIVSKYLKPLSLKDLGTFKLKDDIFYDFLAFVVVFIDFTSLPWLWAFPQGLGWLGMGEPGGGRSNHQPLKN